MNCNRTDVRAEADAGMSLIEVMVACAILAGICVSLVSTILVMDTRNRQEHKRTVAFRVAQEALANLEASPAINSGLDLLNQNGLIGTVTDEVLAGVQFIEVVRDLTTDWNCDAQKAIQVRIIVDVNRNGIFFTGAKANGDVIVDVGDVDVVGVLTFP